VAFIDALARFFAPPPALEPRSVSWEKMWGSGTETMGANTIAGIRVSAETAMHAPAVWACVRLISGAIAGLPLHAYRGSGADRDEIALPEWLRRPNPQNPNITRGVHIQQVVTSMLLEGNAFIYALPSVGSTERLRVLDPATVRIHTTGDDTTYHVTGADRPLTPDEIVHIPYQVVPGSQRGLNPIDAARETIGLAMAAEQFSSAFFGNGATLSGVIEYPPGVEPTQPQIDELVRQFKKKHTGASKSYAVGALTGGAQWKPSEGNNRDSQLNELREYQVEDIGRLFGVPPHMIGSQKPGAVAYASVEQRNIDFVTHGLQPVIEKLEDAYERVIRGQRTYFKFNVDGLLRGDAKSRWEAYGIALDKKVVLREEVRAKEDFPNLGELGFLETPNNNAPEPEPPSPAPVTNNSYVLPDTVSIPASVVHVAPPEVHVAAPVVNVAAAEAPIVNVDMAPVGEAVATLRADLISLQAEVRKPRKRRLLTDAEGRVIGSEDA
jgi:HK97 family phage portal protein